MKDIIWGWGPGASHWMLRIWGRNVFYPLLHPLNWWNWHKHQPVVDMILNLFGIDAYSSNPEFEIKNWPHYNGYCYCPEGYATTWRFKFFGFGFWLMRVHDPMDRTKPCT